MNKSKNLKKWAPKLNLALTLGETMLHLLVGDWRAGIMVTVEAVAERVDMPLKLRCAILAAAAIVIAIATMEKAMGGANFLELLAPMFSLVRTIMRVLKYSK